MTERSASVCVIIRGAGTGREVLFIKRAIRSTDRWSGHIALPGGHREAGESDLEAAIREAYEEVGLDLSKSAELVSTLEPRCILPALRNRDPMRLYPFVFVMRPEYANMPLIPQVQEVAAAFWYPLESLLYARNRSFVTINVGDRLRVGPFLKSLLRGQLGEIMFTAILIWPGDIQAAEGHTLPEAPWKLWGITLNVIHEVLLSTFPAVQVAPIQMPTFTSWDMRFYHYIMTNVHRRLVGAPAEIPLTVIDTVSESHQKVLPYALTASIMGRAVAFTAALMHVYRICRSRKT